MPIYEYKCNKCGYFAILNEKIDAERVKDCPACKEKDELERQVSRSTFLLKGEGWTKKHKEGGR